MRKIIKKIKMKKENIMVVLSGAVFMTVMDVSNVLAAGDASSVTKPLDNLKTLVFAIIGAIGVIILAKNVMEFAQAYQAPGEQQTIIKDLGFGESLLMMILAVIIALVIIFCGFMLIYTVYFRFLKILVVVPFGALAFSTVSGNRMVSHSAVSYAKYFLSIVLEAVTMALAIIVCNAFLNAGLPTFTSDYADWTKALMYMCELTFSVAMTVGAVKGAQGLTSKALGL